MKKNENRYVSLATIKNFRKLNKNIENYEFKFGANKQESTRNVIPYEYYDNVQNIEKISEIINIVKNKNISRSIDSLILSYLIKKNIVSFLENKLFTKYEFVEEFIKNLCYDKELLYLDLPLDERDPIGLIYQHLLTEGQKNKKGTYYTPKHIVNDMLNNLGNNGTYCDPCCGTGGFLIESLKYFRPENIYGYDIDELAVKIAKANMFARNPQINYNNNIKHQNFLFCEDEALFDFIVTNPPWGNKIIKKSQPLNSAIRSKESFAFFIEKSLKKIKKNGQIVFLLPIAILNVKLHYDIRQHILQKYKLVSIKEYGKCFNGVLTDVIRLHISHKEINDIYEYEIIDKMNRSSFCPVTYAKENKNYVIPLLKAEDISIIDKIKMKNEINLQSAKFALGIVTGNNLSQIKSEYSTNYRPILTGKEIKKYTYKEANKYIIYDRNNFQQVCSDKFFASKTKFIYKFISKKLIFSLDKQQLLTLNSANIMLLPDHFPLNEYVVLALLNSELLNFYFLKMINQIKILKDDIRSLPLPLITKKTQKIIEEKVKKCIDNNNFDFVEIEEIIFQLYKIEKKEILRIKEVVYGKD